MKMNELFEMITAANKLNQLLDEKTKAVEIMFCSYYFCEEDVFETFKSCKDFISKYNSDELAEQILDIDLQKLQDDTEHLYKGHIFKGQLITHLNNGKRITISIHIY